MHATGFVFLCRLKTIIYVKTLKRILAAGLMVLALTGCGQSTEDVPVKVNVKTICSGILFHANQSLNATFDAEWDGIEDFEFRV